MQIRKLLIVWILFVGELSGCSGQNPEKYFFEKLKTKETHLKEIAERVNGLKNEIQRKKKALIPILRNTLKQN